ncbi:MAG: hypothetical protein ACSHXL_05775, partial [Bacteroidota bacterium]
AGDLYLMQVNKIEEPKNKRLKRLFDCFSSITLLLASPFILWKYKNKGQFYKNLLLILYGKYSIVGYYNKKNAPKTLLPKIKYGILSPSDEFNDTTESQVNKRNLLYARDYSISKDLKILKSCWGKLDKPLK